MTGQLRSTLRSRADQLEAWSPDLDSLMATGERRRRRKRRGAVVGGVVVSLLVTASGVAAVHGLGRGTADVQPTEQGAVPLTYAVGNVVHSGDAQIDVGVTVHALVRLSDGLVFSDPDGRVYLWRDGGRHSLGHLANPTTRLYGSDDGLVAAWWDGHHIQTWPGYASHIQTIDDDKTNEFGVAASWPKNAPPRVEALSDGHLWWWTGRQHMIAEVRPTPTTAGWPDTNPPGAATVVDAAGDHVLARTTTGITVAEANLLPWPVGKQDTWHPGGDLAGLPTQVHGETSGDLAPDGRHWFSTDHTGTHTIAVFDAASGDQQAIRHNGDQITPYAWLGDDTIAAWSLHADHPQGPVSLLTCRVSTNTCAVAAPDVAPIDTLALAGDSSR